MIIILIIDTKYTTFLLFAHHLHLYYHPYLLYPSNLFLSQTFPLLSFIPFFYYTCYYYILIGMHYNNNKADKYRISGSLSLLYMLYFSCALFLLNIIFLVHYFSCISFLLCFVSLGLYFSYALFLLYFISLMLC